MYFFDLNEKKICNVLIIKFPFSTQRKMFAYVLKINQLILKKYNRYLWINKTYICFNYVCWICFFLYLKISVTFIPLIKHFIIINKPLFCFNEMGQIYHSIAVKEYFVACFQKYHLINFSELVFSVYNISLYSNNILFNIPFRFSANVPRFYF